MVCGARELMEDLPGEEKEECTESHGKVLTTEELEAVVESSVEKVDSE